MHIVINSLFNIDFFSWLAIVFFPFVRILALLMVAPITGEKEVPHRVKIGLALLIALLLPLDQLTEPITFFSATGIFVIFQQIIIGIIIGFAMQFTFMTVRLAGELIGMQMGLGMATFFDPVGGPATPVLSRLINVIALLVFLHMDGHLWLIYGIAESFTIIPMTTTPLKINGYLSLIETSSLLFVNGIILALPLVTLLLIINMALGLLNRITPQLSIFVVGYPVTLLLGLIMLSFLMATLPNFVEFLIRQSFAHISSMLGYFVS